MKTRFAILSVAFAVTMCLSSAPCGRATLQFPASNQIESPADFYAPLSAYGEWISVPAFGKCWHPRGLEAGWRPYTRGAWIWTDVGWYWASDEPFGWAAYHYGSWVDDSSYGWVWIPGLDWAPAWVTWRFSEDYIGWAPCGPNRTTLPASMFVFADIHRFRSHRFGPNDLAGNNSELFNRTTVVQNFPRETRRFDGIDRTVVTDPGPGIEPIQRATGQTFVPESIQIVIKQSPIPQVIPRSEGIGGTPVRDPALAPAPVLPEPRHERIPTPPNEVILPPLHQPDEHR